MSVLEDEASHMSGMNIAKSCCRHFKLLAAVSVIGLLSFPSLSRTLDFGVDPERLGTGEWVYVMNTCVKQLGGVAPEVTNAPTMFRYFKQHDIDYIAVKAGTGAKDFPAPGQSQFTPELVKQAHDAGLKIFGYTRSDGKDVPGEIALACKVNAMGADGFIIDAEAEWEESHLGTEGPQRAIQLCQGIRKAYPTRFLGHAPMPIISKHTSFPYKEFGRYCDATMPQAYWKSIGVTPKRMVDWMESEWHAWNDSLSGEWRQAIKPLAPIAQAWSPTKDRELYGAEIVQFANELKAVKDSASPTPYRGISYWRCDLHTAGMWDAIRRVDILKRGPTDLTESEKQESVALEKEMAGASTSTDLILDNNGPDVSLEGKWSPGKMKPNHFGSNYEVAASSATIPTAKAIFRPKITQAGNYDIYVWYPTELAKSGKVPYNIISQGKSERVLVDQTTNGGQWMMISSEKYFAAGTDGYVAISNDLGDDKYMIVADAVRFRKSLLPDQPAPAKTEPEIVTAPVAAPAPVAPVVTAPPVAPVVKSAPPVVPKFDTAPVIQPAPVAKKAPVAKPAPVVKQTPVAAMAKPKAVAKPAASNQGIVVAKAELVIEADDSNVIYEGTWHQGKQGDGFHTENYRWASTSKEKVTASVTFVPDIHVAGFYNVYEWHSANTNRTHHARWEVNSQDGDEHVHISQRMHGGRWVLLAKNKQFAVGKSAFIRLTNDTGERGAGESIIIADAVRLVLKSQDKVESAEPVEAVAEPKIANASTETAAKFAASERDILVDNLNPEVSFEGKWESSAINGSFGSDSMTAKIVADTATATAVYRPTINVPGNYDVFVWFPQNPNNSTNSQWLVSWNGGNAMVSVDQTKDGGQWLQIASSKPFVAGTSGSVTLFNDAADAAYGKKVVADAVRFRLHPAGEIISTSR